MSVRTRCVVLLLSALGLLLAPSAAAADPPAFNHDPCSLQLARASYWPGTVETPTGTHRLVSDAYVSYLSAQPPCSSGD